MSSSTEQEKKMIILRSSDMEVFDVEEEVALQSETIKHMIEDNCADNCIPLPNVTGNILSKVIEYCKKHVDSAAMPPAATNDDLKSFDANFVKVSQSDLFELILAANFLNIKSLLDLTSQAVADLIEHKTVEEVRELFNIENDFTPEEEAKIREEYKWAHE